MQDTTTEYDLGAIIRAITLLDGLGNSESIVHKLNDDIVYLVSHVIPEDMLNNTSSFLFRLSGVIHFLKDVEKAIHKKAPEERACTSEAKECKSIK